MYLLVPEIKFWTLKYLEGTGKRRGKVWRYVDHFCKCSFCFSGQGYLFSGKTEASVHKNGFRWILCKNAVGRCQAEWLPDFVPLLYQRTHCAGRAEENHGHCDWQIRLYFPVWCFNKMQLSFFSEFKWEWTCETFIGPSKLYPVVATALWIFC